MITTCRFCAFCMCWAIVVFALSAQVVSAGFTLNFTPDNTGIISTSVIHGSSVINGQTPYLRSGGNQLPEIVVDPETGLDYYHMIVGSVAEGFIQETYIERGFSSFPFSTQGSAVGGDGNSSGGNGLDPLDITTSINTANGEANPRKVLVRQIISDGEIMMEFLKDKFEYKPLIVQQLNAPDIIASFQIDMRNSRYDDMNTPGVIYNTMSLPTLEQQYFNGFDFARDTQDVNVTGGRYTYTTGTGPGGSDGTYTYLEGGFDHKNQPWDDFYDPTEANPWSYSTYKP